ncbi:MAG: hypothetical protein WCG47_16060, partial [Dermatophilaceae bacterium]
SVGVHPQVTNMPALLDVLGHYPDVPEAVAAGTALDKLVNGPAIPLFKYSYEQTPASVSDVAAKASSMRQQVLLVKVWLPVGLAVTALLSLAIGAVIFVRRRPRPMDQTLIDETHPVPRPTEDERELVTTGKGS